MKKIVFIILLALSVQANAQIKATHLQKSDLPDWITSFGKFVDAISYNDKEGEHIVVIAETGIYSQKEDQFRSGKLYAVNYLKKGNVTAPEWKLYDFITDCPVDVTVRYIPNTFAVTDLDHNGIAEVWVMYRTACRGG